MAKNNAAWNKSRSVPCTLWDLCRLGVQFLLSCMASKPANERVGGAPCCVHHSSNNLRVVLQLGSEALFGRHGDSAAMPLVAMEAAHPFHGLETSLFPPLFCHGQGDQQDEGCTLVPNVRRSARQCRLPTSSSLECPQSVNQESSSGAQGRLRKMTFYLSRRLGEGSGVGTRRRLIRRGGEGCERRNVLAPPAELTMSHRSADRILLNVKDILWPQFRAGRLVVGGGEGGG